ncbi:MAG TPA: FAD/NAD(P)-binding protein [Nitrospiria bacterium]|nr:FAD/NAD(P)-binding protein [Nitrospiria bacterium]
MNAMLPMAAEVVERRREAPKIWTLRLRFTDEAQRRRFQFRPGQFNMVYHFGVGEVPISIVSDPSDPELLDHTIRAVGAVSHRLCELDRGDVIGLRGPYGSWWPLEEARGRDVLIVTGGLGCAPVVAAINYVMARREAYGALKIFHGIKTPGDLLYRERFRAWRKAPDTEVYLTVDRPDRRWKEHVGVVTTLFRQARIDPDRSLVMMCGPEVMMRFAVRELMERGVTEDRIYVSMERNMKCAVGFCGHCQYGPLFICKEGPVLRYDRISRWFDIKEL